MVTNRLPTRRAACWVAKSRVRGPSLQFRSYKYAQQHLDRRMVTSHTIEKVGPCFVSCGQRSALVAHLPSSRSSNYGERTLLHTRITASHSSIGKC